MSNIPRCKECLSVMDYPYKYNVCDDCMRLIANESLEDFEKGDDAK